MDRQKTFGPVLAAIAAVSLWCFSGVCFRKGALLVGTMPYLTCIAAIGSLTAALLHAFSGQPLASLVRLPVQAMVSGTLGVSVYTVMLAFAFGIAPEADLGQVNLLNLMWPFWVVVLGFILLKDRPRPFFAITGILLGVTGVIVSRGFDQLTRPPTNFTAPLLALAGGFMWALYSVLLRKWKADGEQGGTTFNFAVSAVLAGAMGFVTGEWKTMPAWSWESLFWVLFGGIGPVGLAYSWWEIGVKKGPVFLIAALAYFIPIGSSLLIGLMFRESLNIGLLFGALSIAGGAWVVKLSDSGS